MHHGSIGDGEQLPRDGVPGSQDVEPLPAGCGTNEDAGDTPQTTKEGAVNEVSGVDEEDVASSRLGGVECGLKFGGQKLPLHGDMLGERLFGGTGTARVCCQRTPSSSRYRRVCVRARSMRMRCVMRLAASAT